MAREMTPQERSAAPVEVRQALADKVKNLIVSNLTHEENQLWLANVDAFEERAYQRGRRSALLEAADIAFDHACDDPQWCTCNSVICRALTKLAQEG